MEKRFIKLFDVHQPLIDNLNQALCTYNWFHLTIDRDIDSVYNAFKIVTEWRINLFVPQTQVTLSLNTLSFVTPLIKSLLQKRIKLTCCEQVQMADDLTTKMGRLILNKRQSFLSKVDINCTK